MTTDHEIEPAWVFDETFYFTGDCTCEHPAGEHGIGSCGIGDCTCAAGWEE